MNNLGDFATGGTIYGKFTTFQPSTGAAFALAGTPALSVYKDNSTTQSTSGVTLTASFDSVTGLNHFAIDTSSDGTFYSAGSQFDIVITTGTVDSVSVVGAVVGSFSLNRTAALRPTTAGRALDVSAGGEAGIDWANIGSPTTAVNLSSTNIDVDQVVASVSGNVGGSVASVASGGISEASFATTTGAFIPLGITRQGTAQSVSGISVVLDASAPFGDDTIIGQTIAVFGSTQGYWQVRTITDYVNSTDTATIDSAFTVTPTGTITFRIFGTASASGGGGGATAAEVWAYGDRQLTALDEDATTIDLNNTAVGSVAGAVGSVTGNVGGNVTGSVGSVATNGLTAASIAADAVTEIQSGLATAAALATVDTVVDAIQAQTDQLGFTSGSVDANITHVIADPVQTNGATDTNWGGAP